MKQTRHKTKKGEHLMTYPQHNDFEKKQFMYFLEKYKKQVKSIKDNNETTVRKKQAKLLNNDHGSISYKKAFKIKRKVSESQRNVDYYKKELDIVDKAMDDIAHNQDTYEVNQAKARNALDHIKSEMSLILGLALFIYLLLNAAAVMAPILKSLLPVMMVLITVVCVAIYDMKCKQYNAVQQSEDSKIGDTLIAVGRPFIFKWFAMIFFMVIIAWLITPYLKWYILPYFTHIVAPFFKYIVVPMLKLLMT